jgi:very-short-patch-repair endonuclease
MHKLSFATEPTREPRRRTGVEPFLGSEAVAAGVITRHELATRYEAIYRNVYLPRGQQVTPALRAQAAWLWSRRRATVVGVSAAAMHGTKWIDSRLPAELNQASQRKTRNIVLHNDTLSSNEITVVRGMPVTTAARTAFDLGRRFGRTLAVIRVDALLQATALQLSDIDAVIDRHRGARGIVQLREVVGLADAGAESPQETRTRLVLTDAGLRPRRTQINVFNRFGDHIHRIDMGWPEWKVGVEYDGEQHWKDPATRAKDIDQQAELEALSWRLIRVSAEILRYRPHTIVQRTRAALMAAGAPV